MAYIPEEQQKIELFGSDLDNPGLDTLIRPGVYGVFNLTDQPATRTTGQVIVSAANDHIMQLWQSEDELLIRRFYSTWGAWLSYVDVVSDQTITGVKTFTSTPKITSNNLIIEGNSPRILLRDIDTDTQDFLLYTSNGIFYMLESNGTDTGYNSSPYPLQISSATGIAYIYGENIITDVRLGANVTRDHAVDTGSHARYYADVGHVMTGYYVLWGWGDDVIGGLACRALQKRVAGSYVTVSQL